SNHEVRARPLADVPSFANMSPSTNGTLVADQLERLECLHIEASFCSSPPNYSPNVARKFARCSLNSSFNFAALTCASLVKTICMTWLPSERSSLKDWVVPNFSIWLRLNAPG